MLMCDTLPGFEIHFSIQAEEALLTHPLIAQKLCPGRSINSETGKTTSQSKKTTNNNYKVDLEQNRYFSLVIMKRTNESAHSPLSRLILITKQNQLFVLTCSFGLSQPG